MSTIGIRDTIIARREKITKVEANFRHGPVISLSVSIRSGEIFHLVCNRKTGWLVDESTHERLIGVINTAMKSGVLLDNQLYRRIMRSYSADDRTLRNQRYDLTRRELDVLELLVEGLPKKQIAERLYLSFHTVSAHMKRIYVKLRVNNRGKAVSRVIAEGLLRSGQRPGGRA